MTPAEIDAMDISFMSMNGLTYEDPSLGEINTIETLSARLNIFFANCGKSCPESNHSPLMNILDKVNLSTNEINKYTFWDSEKPYTRNLAFTDEKHYTLLVLCWNPGKESKIHNHPCNGCYVKTLRGCVRECRYKVDNDGLLESYATKFYTEGQVSYMSDDLGLHKIGNPNKDTGSVSLHLYTPPYSECKVWHEAGNQYTDFEIGKVGYFSVLGHRSPHLEGRPGIHARLMCEILSFCKTQLIKASVNIWIS